MREIKPVALSGLVSSLLYEKRFGPYFIEPVIAGLSEDNQPFISGMDLIGAPVFPSDFVVSGTCTANLHGTCEAMYRPDMEPEEVSAFLSAPVPPLLNVLTLSFIIVSATVHSCLRYSPSVY